MKRVATITFITHFVTSGIALAVPLALLERGVSLVEIGMVLSILPMIFLTVRVVFAAIADQIGWSPIFLLNSINLTLATSIYLYAKSPLEFAIGKIFEGFSISAFWAVGRTATYALSPGREARESTKIIATASIGGALGGALTGFIMSIMGVNMAFTILTITSMIQVYPTILLWKIGRNKSKLNLLKALKALDPRGKEWNFWYISIIMAVNSLSRYPLFNLVLPVYMAKEIKYSYMEIGFITMLYQLTSSITIYTTLKLPLSLTRAILQSIIYFIACISIPNFLNVLPIIMMIMAFADGLGARFYETIIAKAVRNKRETISIDIGILHVPMRIFESTALIIFGFIVEIFGYEVVFIISGLAYILYSIQSYLESKER
ncbi:MAG: MFS transporter [Candidatus Methanomethylicia archaeon]